MPKINPREGAIKYIGLDPGASGGIAVVSVEEECYDYALLEMRPRTESVLTQAMPDTERDVWDFINGTDLDGAIHRPIQRFAVIEKVQGYIGQSPTTGSSMFKFGQSYGALRMALIAANVPFEEVQPNVWQRAIGIPPRRKDEKRTEFKNRLKARAQQLFPKLTVTLAVADALLIAEFCRRKREGKL